jgi:hypothetical protein
VCAWMGSRLESALSRHLESFRNPSGINPLDATTLLLALLHTMWQEQLAQHRLLHDEALSLEPAFAA